MTEEDRVKLCQEAIRLAETRLKAQEDTLRSYETRASAMLAGAVGGIVGGLSVVFGRWAMPLQAGAIISVGVFAWAGFLAVMVFLPGAWTVPGRRPSQVLEMDEGETLAMVLESVAQGYEGGVTSNSARLTRVGRIMRWVVGLLLAAPIAGVASAALFTLLQDIGALGR